MVQCIIAYCNSSCRHDYKDRKMVFFSVPSEPKGKKRRGKDGEYHNRLMNIKRCQHEAWMLAVNRGYGNNVTHCANDKNVRICIHHFHPSVYTCNDNGKYTLKIGAAPTMYLNKFGMDNDAYKEDKNKPRIVGSPEDINYVHEHLMKKK